MHFITHKVVSKVYGFVWIENVFLPLCKLLTKAEVGYRIIQLLACNCKALKGDLDLQRNPIKKS